MRSSLALTAPVFAISFTAGSISDAELGQRFEQEILPFWRTQNGELQKENETLKGPEREFALLVADFVKLRYDWASALVDATKNNDPDRAAGRSLPKNGDYVFQWRGERIDDCNTLAFQTAVKAAKVAPSAGTTCGIPGRPGRCRAASPCTNSCSWAAGEASRWCCGTRTSRRIIWPWRRPK
jgi:hypothetical protein